VVTCLKNSLLVICGLVLTGCNSTKLTPDQTSLKRTPEFQAEIDQVIKQDADNKHWARMMLSEIDSAIMNDDYQAYVFYLHEYEIIPKEIVPEQYRNEPGYARPVSELEEYFRLRVHLRATHEEPLPIPPHAE
jgi:hypothetical protein